MKFVRPKGFVGSIPRNWVDKNLPICPFCQRRSEWEMGTKLGLLQTRTHFRCPHADCMVVISIPTAFLTRSLSIEEAIYKRLKGKRYKRMMMRVESSGHNRQAEALVDSELELIELRAKGGGLYCPQCGALMAQEDRVCGSCGTKVDS